MSLLSLRDPAGCVVFSILIGTIKVLQRYNFRIIDFFHYCVKLETRYEISIRSFASVLPKLKKSYLNVNIEPFTKALHKGIGFF